MEQPQVLVSADIGEVRMETRTAECNRLLAQGWVLLGVYPLTTLGDMTEGGEPVPKILKTLSTSPQVSDWELG
jgi:hypothetical protein